MEIKGTVKQILPTETGTSKTGKDWSKSGLVITFQNGSFEISLAFSCMGDKIQQIESLKTGQTVTVFFNPESREFNGKWYTDLKIWKVVGEEVIQQPEPASDLPF